MNEIVTYSISGNEITVEFSKKMIHIHNDTSFQNLMEYQPKSDVIRLSEWVQSTFYKIHQREFQVKKQSIIIEIWGHYYAEIVLRAFAYIFHVLRLRKIQKRLEKATEIIDCGEYPEDKNRKIWDILSVIFPIIQFFIKDKKRG